MRSFLIALFGLAYGMALSLWCLMVASSYKHLITKKSPKRVTLTQPLDYVVFEKRVIPPVIFWEEL